MTGNLPRARWQEINVILARRYIILLATSTKIERASNLLYSWIVRERSAQRESRHILLPSSHSWWSNFIAVSYSSNSTPSQAVYSGESVGRTNWVVRLHDGCCPRCAWCEDRAYAAFQNCQPSSVSMPLLKMLKTPLSMLIKYLVHP